MRDINGAQELSSDAPRRGQKFRKPTSPIRRNITPAKYRAITEAVLIAGFSFSIGAITWCQSY
jgi:hypothetical protein